MKGNTGNRTTAVPIAETAEVHRHHLELLAGFFDRLAERGLSEITVKRLCALATEFLHFLETNEIIVEHVTANDIASFWVICGERLSSASMAKVRYMLRQLFSYLYAIGTLEYDLTYALPPAYRGRTTRIKRYFSDDEIAAVLAAIDCTTIIGKRDFAILMIAMTTALRAGDIGKLKIADIDWDRAHISIVQHKNGRLLTVPLLPCTGNAILDYVLNGRPNTGNPFLFLTCRLPYREIKSMSCCKSIVDRRVDAAGIDRAGRVLGFHSFRVHAASRLLAEGVPLSTISSFLGHRSPLSIKPYLSVDVAGMRSCCLSLKGIEVGGCE